MPPLREMLSVASPTPPPTAEGGSSELYFFAVTIAAVSVVLVVSNIIAFSCCSSCYPVEALWRLLGTRRHWTECSSGGPVPQGIRGIPICKYQTEQRHDIECSVCLSAFVEGEDVRHLPNCKHSFHAPCIDMWLHSHSNCPLCRANISTMPDSRGLQPPNEQGDMAAVVVALSD